MSGGDFGGPGSGIDVGGPGSGIDVGGPGSGGNIDVGGGGPAPGPAYGGGGPGSANNLQYGNWTPAFFMPARRSIGGIMAQVTIDEQASDDIQITEHPVEQGAPIADHAFKRPAQVTIRAGWTRQYAWDLSAESGVYGLLLSWQAALLPFDVYTGKRHYTNMLIERLQVTTDQHSEFALMATIACRQVIIVSTSTTTVKMSANSDNSKANPDSDGNENDGGDKQPTQTGKPDETPGTAYQPLQDPNATPADYPIGPSGQPELQTPADYTQGPETTPAATAANNQMNNNGAEGPNYPPVDAASAAGF